MTGIKYTPAETEWLRENFFAYQTAEKLTDAFNATFNTYRTKYAIINMCRRMGILRCTEQKFTAEENEWLAENVPKLGFKKAYAQFCELFDHPCCLRTVMGHCNNVLKIYSGSGRPRPKMQIGDKRKEAGYVWVKVADKPSSRIDRKRDNWKPKHILVYEQHYGAVPDGHMVIFMDGNRFNFDPSNLMAIPLKNAAIMARNKWYTDSPKHNLVALKWCDLYFALQEENT